MQLVRTQMRVPSCHRQTLVPQQICYVFERSTFHPQPACKRMSQVVPAKILDLRLEHGVVEPMPPVSERLTRLLGLEHTALPVAPVVHNPQGGNRSII
jgi:hypothetical protein